MTLNSDLMRTCLLFKCYFMKMVKLNGGLFRIYVLRQRGQEISFCSIYDTQGQGEPRVYFRGPLDKAELTLDRKPTHHTERIVSRCQSAYS